MTYVSFYIVINRSLRNFLLCRRFQSEDLLTELEAKCQIGRMVVYGSAMAHSSVKRAAMLAGVNARLLDTDGGGSLRGESLDRAIQEDVDRGLGRAYFGTLCT